MRPDDDDHYIICELCGDDLDTDIDSPYLAPYCTMNRCPYREPPPDMSDSEKPTLRIKKPKRKL